jgi:hypothetical protein
LPEKHSPCQREEQILTVAFVIVVVVAAAVDVVSAYEIEIQYT